MKNQGILLNGKYPNLDAKKKQIKIQNLIFYEPPLKAKDDVMHIEIIIT